MRWTTGRIVALAAAVVVALLLIYDAPFEAASAAAAAASQVVFAPITSPPVINGAPAKLDLPILLLELVFVAFVAGWIFFATNRDNRGR